MANRVVQRRSRSEIVAERRLVPQAKLIGDFVRQVILDSIGEVDWSSQAADAIALASDRVIKQLSGSQNVMHNTHPLSSGACYAYPARTREEILSKADIAASQRNVGADEEPIDPTEELAKTSKIETKNRNVEVKRKKEEAPRGWLL